MKKNAMNRMNRWIFITGASSGFGKACAEMALAKGWNVFAVARRKERLARLKVPKSSRSRLITQALDVRDRAQVENLARNHGKTLRQTRALINNAGLAKGAFPLQEGRAEDWDAMIDTNLKGFLWVTRALLPHLIRNKGHILNMGSVAGRWVYPKGNVYCATKSAVRALNEALRLDLSGTGVRVTEIAPGMAETEFSEVRLGDKEKAKAVYAGMAPLVAKDIAECVFWCLERPPRVNVQELVLYPTDQASPTVVHRR